MLQAIGLGMLIIVLEVLVPGIFSELSKTIIVFLHSAQIALAAAGQIASVAGTLSH
jgi:hypothetical protein